MSGFDVHCNGFSEYCDEHDLTSVDEHETGADAWRKLSPEEKQAYEEKAKAHDYSAFNYYIQLTKRIKPDKSYSQLASFYANQTMAQKDQWMYRVW